MIARHNRYNQPWTIEEVQLLLFRYRMHRYDLHKIAQLHGRTVNAVRSKLHRLRQGETDPRRWSLLWR